MLIRSMVGGEAWVHVCYMCTCDAHGLQDRTGCVLTQRRDGQSAMTIEQEALDHG